MWQETAFSARSRCLSFSWDNPTFACLFRTYQSQAWQAFERSSLRCLCCVLKDDQNIYDLLFKTQFKVFYSHNLWCWWSGSPVKTLTPQFSTELSGEKFLIHIFPDTCSEQVQEISQTEPNLHLETFCNQLALNKIPGDCHRDRF